MWGPREIIPLLCGAGVWVCAVFLHWRSHVRLSRLNVTVCRPTGTAIVSWFPVGSPSRQRTVRVGVAWRPRAANCLDCGVWPVTSWIADAAQPRPTPTRSRIRRWDRMKARTSSAVAKAAEVALLRGVKTSSALGGRATADCASLSGTMWSASPCHHRTGTPPRRQVGSPSRGRRVGRRRR